MDRRREKKSGVQALETVGILAFFCLLFGIILDVGVLTYTALGLLFIGLFIKPMALIIAEGWTKFAVALGAVTTRIVLFFIFYFILTPIAYLYRLTHSDIMNIRKDDQSKKSFWKERNQQYKPEDLEKQW